MLRSLSSGISGLRAHQTMLDTTGNNIANVNTAGFKGASVLFQDTLSQAVGGAAIPGADAGGRNPAQVGLGVQVAGIRTNFSQGAAQTTGRGGDLMIQGDGFFAVRSGGETLYTRAGGFGFDGAGNMVTADGAFVQGWTAQNGVVATGQAAGTISLPQGAVSPARATTAATVTGNLPSSAAVGDQLVRDIDVHDAQGAARTLSLTFTRTATGWDVTEPASGATGTLSFTDGRQTAGLTLNAGGVAVDLTAVTGFADMSTVAITSQDGAAAGTLQSYSITGDGSIVGTFSNGRTETLAKVAMVTFANAEGLEKVGGTAYRATVNSGGAQIGEAGQAGFGKLVSGSLEMSNVDLSQEFTNLIVAQRGFQASARIITTSDEVLQELTNLKR
ncbi:flagellar hook protein FlgE [Microbacterium sp. AG157]|uniref:Flagellar hook protein FlgE n=1 Tax=Microbacterium testaceum TaxID=2033 RepID=A0A4Y3QII2_MICTE|nr:MULTISPECIES: flagellar hook protein FlgE [Microbacterium]PNW07878.1 flagellar hook protein [Microbacterium testaceum]REC99451.1 flagellar hook protein FlgE [Microbacterium sp. AG157]WJS91830.1 flagellar hook protein FlgE [Microbacterium testaceum]GEB44483.1 flagellar hook protein FlgE [Microbacterium testaceum]